MYRRKRDRYHVLDQNIHNMDEHGLCIGKINPRRVVGKIKDDCGKPCRRTKLRNSENREWVSIVECISARATCIQPLIISEGINVNINWAPDDPPPYKYTAVPTAWINDDIAVWWLNEIFLPQTKPPRTQYRILLFDNHNSHLSGRFESECRKQRVITIPLPAHTSDVLQPLDLIMFSPIKGKYKDKLYQLCELNDGDNTKKKDFCHLYHEARREHLNHLASCLHLKRLVLFHSTLNLSSTGRMSSKLLTNSHQTNLNPYYHHQLLRRHLRLIYIVFQATVPLALMRNLSGLPTARYGSRSDAW
jgi:hypothetical protein